MTAKASHWVFALPFSPAICSQHSTHKDSYTHCLSVQNSPISSQTNTECFHKDWQWPPIRAQPFPSWPLFLRLTGTPLGFLLTGQSSPKDCTSSSPRLTLLVGNPLTLLSGMFSLQHSTCSPDPELLYDTEPLPGCRRPDALTFHTCPSHDSPGDVSTRHQASLHPLTGKTRFRSGGTFEE